MKKSLLSLSSIFFSGLIATAYSQNSANLFINEFMVSNVLSYENANGDYEDWIEIYNSGDSPVDLAGYYMTDDLDAASYWQIPTGQPGKTTVPANGFLVLCADNRPELGPDHLGFKLDKDSEQIFLLNTDGITVIDGISYQDQFRDISYARSPDGAAVWIYTIENTPGSANSNGYVNFALTPAIDQNSGFYVNGLSVTVQPAQTGDNIRYTLDGSDPDKTCEPYNLSIPINQTAILKVCTTNSGTLPSPIISRAYFINAEYDLPVLALMTDPDNLYDPVSGIYVHDYDGRAWERFAELEYFKDQDLQFHIPCGIRIQGNTGPTEYDKKSFRAYFREGFGRAHLNYNLFPRDSVQVFNCLVLRSGYDDSLEPTGSGKNDKATLLRDPLVTELWRQTGYLTAQSSFAVMYLNDGFHGIYDIKQSIDENFVMDHLGYGDIDLVRTRWDSTQLVYGVKDEWEELISFFQNNTFGSDAKISEAAQYMDLDNFITLQALMHAVEFQGWAYGTFMFRNKLPGAVWEWTIWDADRSYSDVTWNGFTNQYNPLGISFDNTITKKLLQNQSFKNRFINRLADLLNTAFSSENMEAIIDSLALRIAADIPAEVDKWNNTVTKWAENIELMRTFARQRPTIVRQQIQNYFLLSGQAGLTVDVSGGNGKIKINSVVVDQFPWSGTYFQDIPVTITAIPAPGYRFAGWSDPALSDQQTIAINLNGAKSLSATFRQLEDANAELIAPGRLKSGRYLPVVVRIRDTNWGINPVEQTPMPIGFSGIRGDTTIQIKRGAGTAAVQINAASDFTLSVQNANVALIQKQISILSVPTISYSGTLSTGDVIWDDSADRLITGNLTVPLGCNLIIKPGTWVIVQKYINFYVQGQIIVEGTAGEPVVITSENWSEPWGGMEFQNGSADFKYCFILNGGGDMSKGHPTSEDWHTGHQHIFFGKDNSELNFDNCFFMYSPGKVFGAQDSKVAVTNSVTAFVWHGGEFHRALLFYQNSHMLNLPNDDHIYTEDIDTDGFHIDYVSSQYPQYSVIDRCYFVTGKDDAIDHHGSRLRISNCWLEDFIHEGVAASGGDTVRIFNTVSLNNDQGFEAGWTESGVSKGPFVLIDHCVAVGNNVGLRIGDSYTNSYRCYMNVTNSILYNNDDNIWNYLLTTQAPLPGALEISYSMTNDTDYDTSAFCITGIPQFDAEYYLLPGSPGIQMGLRGTNMGRADSSVINAGAVVINEIMHNAPADLDSKDWIELYNPQPVEQDISDWLLKDSNDAHVFQIQAGTIIPARGYWVLCTDSASFHQVYPGVNNYSGEISFGFGDVDQVRLFTAVGNLVDSVSYSSTAPWPDKTDGEGYSLELIDPTENHNNPKNWGHSILYGGSPGRANRTTDTVANPEPPLLDHFVLKQNYPNPFNPVTTIEYLLPKAGRVNLVVYNILGQQVRELVDQQYRPAGTYKVEFNAGNLSSGIYIYRLQFASGEGTNERQVLTRKMVLIK
jgi:hypothetical protein